MHGVYAMSAITALTAQNTMGVRSIYPVSADFLKQQIDAVFEDIRPDAVKIGMISSPELAEVIAERLIYYNAENIVTDPVADFDANYTKHSRSRIDFRNENKQFR